MYSCARIFLQMLHIIIALWHLCSFSPCFSPQRAAAALLDELLTIALAMFRTAWAASRRLQPIAAGLVAGGAAGVGWSLAGPAAAPARAERAAAAGWSWPEAGSAVKVTDSRHTTAA